MKLVSMIGVVDRHVTENAKYHFCTCHIIAICRAALFGALVAIVMVLVMIWRGRAGSIGFRRGASWR
jgi:hypothetical protein